MTIQISPQKVTHPTYGVGTIVDSSIWGSLKVDFSGTTRQVATARVIFLKDEVEDYLSLLENEVERVKKEATINEVIYSELRNGKDI